VGTAKDRDVDLKLKHPDWDWDYWEAMLEAFELI
jgi:hypothetical protein|tara:strand:+ start:1875 stop:1976 length:102 start_codon:yes stop_codon:yes gene_type:complete